MLAQPAHRWLLLALTAIGLAALFAVVLVVARTPLLQQAFGFAGLFHTVLVLHVNFAVLIWLLSMGACLWQLEIPPRHPFLDALAFGLAVAGALLLCLTPLLAPPLPVMSNYIPILHHPAFLTGLCAFAGGIGLSALRRLTAPRRGAPGQLSALSALALLAALAVFALTAWRLPHPIDSAAGFEALFWGGGHMLQLVYLLLLQGAWLRLGPPTPPLSRRGVALLGLPLAAGLLLALYYPPLEPAYRSAFTRLMQFGAPLLLLPLLPHLWRAPLPRSVRLSQLLLLAGLLLGMMIRADNVTVTAHYHATNAAITLAFMALAYRLLPQLGLGEVAPRRAARQLQLYFGGMALYIGGMALSGWLDVPRKTPMSAEGWQALALGLMGLGGLIAIAATLLFFLLHASALWQQRLHGALLKGMGGAG